MDMGFEESTPMDFDKDNPATLKVRNREDFSSTPATGNLQNGERQEDGDRQHNPEGKGMPSFRDTLASGARSKKGKIEVRPEDVNYEVREGCIPRINFSDKIQQQMAENMEFTVVIRPLGIELTYGVLYRRLMSLWKPRGDIRLLDHIDGYFFIILSNESDYNTALLEGPWIVSGHYVQVLPWVPKFDTKAEHLSGVATWIRIPGLPIEYYHEDILRWIVKPIGKLIRADRNTVDMVRGKFARVAVQVDLTKPLLGKMKVDDIERTVQYEDLKRICYSCGKYGHTIEECPTIPGKEKAATTTGIGEGQTEVQSEVPEMMTAQNRETLDDGTGDKQSLQRSDIGPWIQAVKVSRKMLYKQSPNETARRPNNTHPTYSSRNGIGIARSKYAPLADYENTQNDEVLDNKIIGVLRKRVTRGPVAFKRRSRRNGEQTRQKYLIWGHRQVKIKNPNRVTRLGK